METGSGSCSMQLAGGVGDPCLHPDLLCLCNLAMSFSSGTQSDISGSHQTVPMTDELLSVCWVSTSLGLTQSETDRQRERERGREVTSGSRYRLKVQEAQAGASYLEVTEGTGATTLTRSLSCPIRLVPVPLPVIRDSRALPPDQHHGEAWLGWLAVGKTQGQAILHGVWWL